MRNLFVGSLLGVVGCSLFTIGSSGVQVQNQQPTQEVQIFFVTGTGWQACSDWKEYSHDLKIGYLRGHVDTRVQLLGFITDKAVKESFDRPEGITYSDEMKALDSFCSDYRNMRIPLVNADGLIISELSGGPPTSDKTFRMYRCLAAAGTDADKIRDCYAHSDE